MKRILFLVLLGASCASTAERDLPPMRALVLAELPVAAGSPVPRDAQQRPTSLDKEYADLGIGGRPRPDRYMHGYIGANFVEEVTRRGGTQMPVEGDIGEWPVIGGGGQWVLGGERIDLGLEGMINFGGRANAAAFAIGGGGAVIAVDVDLLVLDFYGGPFVSTFLGEKLRVYGGAGPLIQFAQYDEAGAGITDRDGSGFGTGYYARTGAEILVRPGTLVGFGVRWIESHVDLDSNLGDLDISGIELFFSVTQY